MSKKSIIKLSAMALVVLAVVLLAFLLPTETIVDCDSCGGSGDCADCNGFGIVTIDGKQCKACMNEAEIGTGNCTECEGTGEVTAPSKYYATFMALVPPIVAIGLALITKEVYSSLFVGIVLGALFASNYSFAGTVDAVVSEGIVAAVSGTAGIFVFLVILGILVALLNRAGGAQAFGKWAETHVRTRLGATLATFALGVLIFIDDYFNCLTVGAVMRPVTDKHRISRAKLAFIIDATAAPICMIAPVSSWAAAVSGYVDEKVISGPALFLRAIPFNFYSLLTIVFVITIAIMGFDYGKMSGFEILARRGDLHGGAAEEGEAEEAPATTRARVFDLLIPIIVLIVACVFGLLYDGGLFKGKTLIDAFGGTDATVGLPWGALIALIFVIIYFSARRLLTPGEMMKCIPQGFIAMVPAILILTFATGLKNVTGLLGADMYVDAILGEAEALKNFLPAIIFLIACFLAFSTGTSWGTFGILIPIVMSVFGDPNQPIFFVGVSACLAGAVCGDHCSPISDTTIMASAGARCNHLNHVSTQLPYAITVAAVSFVMYIFAGFVPYAWIALPVGIALMIGTLFGIKYYCKRRGLLPATTDAE